MIQEILNSSSVRLFALEDGSIFFTPVSPTQITANQNNYNLGNGTFYRLSTDANRSITGFLEDDGGRLKILVHTSAFVLTLVNQSASSDAANRVLTVTGTDISLSQNEMAWVIYDDATDRWRAGKIENLTSSGIVNALAGVQIGVGTSAAGKIFLTADSGLVLRCYTGVTNDFEIRAQDGTVICRVPVGKALLYMSRRLETAKGSNVTAANDTTLFSNGNVFTITGNTQINGIATADWQSGSVVILIFSGTPTVKHNTAASAGFASLLLSGSADLVAAANTVLQLVYDGTNWQEVTRKAA